VEQQLTDINTMSRSNKKLTKYTKNALLIFHQNICGLPNKQDELLYSLTEYSPQIICLTEHHLHNEELEGTMINRYTLGAKFCRKINKSGGACIFIKDNLHLTNINMDKYSKEMDIEICAIKIHTPSSVIIIMTVYRSPTGDITHFLDTLEIATDQLYNNTINIILCGDFNINYLNDNKKQKLNSILTSYSLYSIIDFPTSTNNLTSTAIDNVFINKFKYENYEIYPLINGLSDHDAQILRLPDKSIPNYGNELYTYRQINEYSLNEFQNNLSHETRQNVFSNDDKDTNTIFNNFLDTFLKIFNASFPVKKTSSKQDNKKWLKMGIRTSCNNKR